MRHGRAVLKAREGACAARRARRGQVIKLYAWELPFQTSIMKIRKEETGSLRRASRFKSVNDGLFLSASPLMLLCTFLPYIALGNPLTAAAVFPTLAFYSIVRLSVTNFVPRAIEAISEARISLQRLQTFLSLDEIDVKQLHANRSNPAKLGGVAIHVEKATFRWPVVRREKRADAPPTPAVATMTAPKGGDTEEEAIAAAKKANALGRYDSRDTREQPPARGSRLAGAGRVLRCQRD